jgi:hypothetical protein
MTEPTDVVVAEALLDLSRAIRDESAADREVQRELLGLLHELIESLKLQREELSRLRAAIGTYPPRHV